MTARLLAVNGETYSTFNGRMGENIVYMMNLIILSTAAHVSGDDRAGERMEGW